LRHVPRSKMPFTKPWLCWTDQISKLKDRGIVFADEAAAEAFLSHINYYRFSGYCLAFEEARHAIAPGTTFEQIYAAYRFDCALRDLVGEALEHIEIDVRTTVAYCFGEAHRPMGHVDPANFHEPTGIRAHARKGVFRHADWIAGIRRECRRSSEAFVTHFREKYDHGDDLPIWVATEIMSFNGLSRMYKGMLRDDRRAVSRRYGLQPRDFESWLHHLVYIRNICAHHARLWDRQWHIQPRRPHGKGWQPSLVPSTDRLFATILVLYRVMTRCDGILQAPAAWRDAIFQLLREPPPCQAALQRMGLPVRWEEHPLWS